MTAGGMTYLKNKIINYIALSPPYINTSILSDLLYNI